MFISMLNKLAWVIFALTIGIGQVQSQENEIKNETPIRPPMVCLEQITGLTEIQKTQLGELATEHRKNMDQLRTERRSAAPGYQKESVSDKMAEAFENHQNKVKNILTDKQKKEYDLLHQQCNFRRGKWAENQNSQMYCNRNRQFGNLKFARAGNMYSQGQGKGFRMKNGCRGNANNVQINRKAN